MSRKFDSLDQTEYEIVKRDGRNRKDIQVLPRKVRGQRAAQAIVDRLQKALERSHPTAALYGVHWAFRETARSRFRR